MGFEILDASLKYLAHWYEQEGIEEIAVNRPKEVCIRLAGKRKNPWIFEVDEKLNRDYLMDVMYIVANTYELPFDPLLGLPVVFATLPGQHRFTGIAGRNVMYDKDDLQGGIAMSIRKYRKDVSFDFADYGLKKGEELTQLKQKKPDEIKDSYEKLMTILKNGEHLLISGSTSTGKTTFLNNLLKVVSKDARIITIEDTRELMVTQRNHVHIVLSRTQQSNMFTYANVIDLVVRMTPDVIIGGEISTENAGAIWELLGTGHENFLASIHAESPDAAYKGFIDRITHTYTTVDRNMLYAEMKKKLHVVQISRDGNLRAVTEIV